MGIKRNAITKESWSKIAETNENSFVADSKAMEMESTSSTEGVSGRIFGGSLPVVNCDKEEDFEISDQEMDDR